MNDIIPFKFESRQVRTVVIQGKPWFVGTDVATILGYASPPNAIARHCKKAQSAGGHRFSDLHPQTKLISEPDLYRLIMGSTLESAERFEEWVYEEVLPTIRKTGGVYMTAQKAEEILADPDLIIGLAQQVKQLKADRERLTEYNHRLSGMNRELTEKIAEDASLVDFAKHVSASEGSLNLTETAKILDRNPRYFITMLRREGVLYRRSEVNLPMQKYLDKGYFEVVTLTANGRICNQTRVTGKGQEWLAKFIKRRL